MSVHNNAKKGDISDFVLLPGDPQRAKYIAEKFLTNVFCYNKVRGMLGYTGNFKGKRISVQGTGMGMPSHSIYVTELLEEYDVQTLIRIGSCGAIQDDVNLMDIILAMSASTDSGMNKNRFNNCDYAPTANFDLLRKAHDVAESKNIKIKAGPILTSDLFYSDDPDIDNFKSWSNYGVLGVDMEAAALYTLAARYNKKALTILTVSDHIYKKQALSAKERQYSFDQMIEVALNLK